MGNALREMTFFDINMQIREYNIFEIKKDIIMIEIFYRIIRKKKLLS